PRASTRKPSKFWAAAGEAKATIATEIVNNALITSSLPESLALKTQCFQIFRATAEGVRHGHRGRLSRGSRIRAAIGVFHQSRPDLPRGTMRRGVFSIGVDAMNHDCAKAGSQRCVHELWLTCS